LVFVAFNLVLGIYHFLHSNNLWWLECAFVPKCIVYLVFLNESLPTRAAFFGVSDRSHVQSVRLLVDVEGVVMLVVRISAERD
jgi:hypothetical protein